MPSTAETDAEDVNDFLKRIQELGTKRDQEDEERNKKLEEEILQGRKERQARRAGLCSPDFCPVLLFTVNVAGN
jgi:predicted sugar kinase